MVIVPMPGFLIVGHVSAKNGMFFGKILGRFHSALSVVVVGKLVKQLEGIRKGNPGAVLHEIQNTIYDRIRYSLWLFDLLRCLLFVASTIIAITFTFIPIKSAFLSAYKRISV